MRRARAWALFFVAMFMAQLVATEQETPSYSPESLMATWRESVRAHQPGERDAALAVVSRWSAAQWTLAYPRVLISITTPAVAFADLESAATFWKRAALLHTDIALFEPTANAPVTVSVGNRVKPPQTVRVPDGRFDGFHPGNSHWTIARVLLDQLPSPGTDPDVRDWYRATAATMAHAFSFAELRPHLERAAQLFPKDAAIQFNLGCLYEAFGSSRVQDVLSTLVLPRDIQVFVDKAGPNLRRAEDHFERVAATSPLTTEAQVRLARVRFLLGQPREAAEALRRLAPTLNEPWLRYSALMFLGQAEETLANAEHVRMAYEQAATLYPGAQSPRLALALLDARHGRKTSIEALHHVLRLPPNSSERADSWPDYYRGDGRRADALLDDVQSRFRVSQ